jgi:hypothetical protein
MQNNLPASAFQGCLGICDTGPSPLIYGDAATSSNLWFYILTTWPVIEKIEE